MLILVKIYVYRTIGRLKNLVCQKSPPPKKKN